MLADAVDEHLGGFEDVRPDHATRPWDLVDRNDVTARHTAAIDA